MTIKKLEKKLMKKAFPRKANKRCYNCGRVFHEDENEGISAYCPRCSRLSLNSDLD